MAKIFTCKHQENIAFISGDDYRKEHPHERIEKVNTQSSALFR